MSHRLLRVSTPLIGLLLSALAACGGSSTADVTSSMSTLNLGITDAPLDSATKVWIQFTGVELKPLNGSAVDISFASARGFDLLALSDGKTASFLNGQSVPAGPYEWVRLMVDATPGASYIIDATGQHTLTIPSGAETGLKLVQGFTMPVGGVADFTVDFVLRKSVIAPPGRAPDYLLKPVLRLIDNAQVGTISGTFQSATLAVQPSCGTQPPVVYVYAGAGVTPDDIYVPATDAEDASPPAGVEPLVTATASLNSNSVYSYSIPFLTAGTYTVAFTCDSDDPAVDESVLMPDPIHFATYPQPVAVTMNMTSTVDF